MLQGQERPSQPQLIGTNLERCPFPSHRGEGGCLSGSCQPPSSPTRAEAIRLHLRWLGLSWNSTPSPTRAKVAASIYSGWLVPSPIMAEATVSAIADWKLSVWVTPFPPSGRRWPSLLLPSSGAPYGGSGGLQRDVGGRCPSICIGPPVHFSPLLSSARGSGQSEGVGEPWYCLWPTLAPSVLVGGAGERQRGSP